MDNVAGVHEAQSNASGEGRGDVGIGYLQLRIVHLTLIKLHRAFELVDRGHLGVELLLGDRVLAVSNLIALQVNAGIFQQGLVAGQLALDLGELGLIRRIDRNLSRGSDRL